MDAEFEIKAIGQKLASSVEQYGHPLPGVEISEISEDRSPALEQLPSRAGISGGDTIGNDANRIFVQSPPHEALP